MTVPNGMSVRECQVLELVGGRAGISPRPVELYRQASTLRRQCLAGSVLMAVAAGVSPAPRRNPQKPSYRR